jgi:acid phosphatase (class A)
MSPRFVFRLLLALAIVAAAGGSLPQPHLIVTAAAQPLPAVAEPAAGAPRPRRTGYLDAGRSLDDQAFLPPPPAVGSALGEADVAIFAATRELENGPRWQLAAADDRLGQPAMLGNFGCALGLDLAAAELPALTRVIARAGADLFPLVGAAKDRYRRPRPFVTEQGPVCIVPSEDFAKSGSYPSGHAASGWLHALLLAEIDSANAAAIINRGRAFGESRVVCGVHYVSDVEGGRLAATAVIAALHGSAEFERDVEAARAEIASLRAAGADEPAARPAAASCAAERASLATPW